MSQLEDLLNNVKEKQRAASEQKAANSKILSETMAGKQTNQTKEAVQLKDIVQQKDAVQAKDAVTANPDRLSSRQIYSSHNQLNYQDAIFSIYAAQSDGDKVGSGFFYAPSGDFVTDLHVVGQAKTLKILLNGGRELTGVIDKRDNENDLAVGHVLEQKTKFPYLIFENPKLLEGYKGEAYAAGWAYGHGFQLLPGTFRKMSYASVVSGGDVQLGEDPMRQVIVSDNYTHASMSGGVIFNKDFLPIGVIAKGDIQDKGAASSTISTPISDCLKLIRQLKKYQLEAKY